MLLSKQKYIVNCEKEVDPPAYLRNRYRGRVTFDLSPIMKKQIGNSTSRYEKKLLRVSNLQDTITHADCKAGGRGFDSRGRTILKVLNHVEI